MIVYYYLVFLKSLREENNCDSRYIRINSNLIKHSSYRATHILK